MLVGGASVSALASRSAQRDLRAALAIPAGVVLLAVAALTRLVLDLPAQVPVGLVFVAAATVAALLVRRTAFVQALTNGAILVPALLVFGASAFYVALPNQPEQVRSFARTFIANPLPHLPGDDHLQYRTAQFVVHRIDPAEQRLFFQWRLTDRTPLVGLAFAETAAMWGADLPPDPLYRSEGWEQRWRVPDEHGYWLYRLFAMLANASVVAAIAFMTRALWGRRAYLVAVALMLVLPFTHLQVLMTYPKMLTAALLTLSFAVTLSKGPLWLAGAGAGLAYLAHPVAVIYVPAIVVAALVRSSPKRLLVRAGALAVPIVMLVGPWMAWTQTTGVPPTRMYAYPLGAYTESSDPQRLEEVIDEQWERLRDDPFGTAVAPRARSFVQTFLFVPPMAPHLRRVQAADYAFYVSTYPLSGAVGLGFVGFAYAGALMLSRRFSRQWLPILVLAPAGALAYWGIDHRPLTPELMHPMWALLVVSGAWMLARVHPVWTKLVFVASLAQSMVVALSTMYRPYPFADQHMTAVAVAGFSAAAAACLLYAGWCALAASRRDGRDDDPPRMPQAAPTRVASTFPAPASGGP